MWKKCLGHVYAFNNLIICIEKKPKKKKNKKQKKKKYIYKKKEEKEKKKRKRAIKQKGDKMPQSKWKQCICTVLEIRMHEYVKNLANG